MALYILNVTAQRVRFDRFFETYCGRHARWYTRAPFKRLRESRDKSSMRDSRVLHEHILSRYAPVSNNTRNVQLGAL